MDSKFQPDLKKLSAKPFAESLTMLLFGDPGTGKTFFAGTAGPRTVILNVGVGDETLRSPAFLKKYPYDPYIIDVPRDVNQFEYCCDSVEWLFKNKAGEFDTIVLDECTAFRAIALQKAIEVNKDLQKTGTADAAKKNRGIISPQIADFGEEINVVNWFLAEITQECKANNVHLIALAHARTTYKKPAKIGEPPMLVKVRPGFTGQTFPDAVLGHFDEVWYLEVVGRGEQKKYRFTTQPNSLLSAKSRHGGVFKETEENIDFPYVVKEIKKHKYIPDPNNPDILIAVKE